MRFAKWVFLLAGVSGVLMVAPLYFLEGRMGQDYPPPINHPHPDHGRRNRCPQRAGVVHPAWRALSMAPNSARTSSTRVA